jgi:hypothetical protein
MSDSELAVVAPQTFQTPSLIERAGPSTRKKFFEFFTVPIRNANTRAAYYRAPQQFLDWVDRAGYQQLEDIEPITVAAYIERLQRQAAPPTVPLKPLNGLPGTPTAGPQNSMTAAARRFCSKTWRGFGIEQISTNFVSAIPYTTVYLMQRGKRTIFGRRKSERGVGPNCGPRREANPIDKPMDRSHEFLEALTASVTGGPQ